MTMTSSYQSARATRSLAWWTRRLALAGLATLAAATAGYGGLAVVAKHRLHADNPPPGQLVDAGDHRMHIHCTGEATGPTVLLEAGNADFSVQWARVQVAVARFARVCAYDRAGLGWSDASPRPRTTAVMVEELEATLVAANVGGPLVLVGHSFGAIIMRQFAHRNPDRVAAVLLVDPAHEQQMELLPAMKDAVEEGAGQFETLAPLAEFGLLALMPGNIPNRGLPAEAHAQYVAVLATTGYFRAAAKETAALPANLRPEAAPIADLGDLPLVVVSRGRPEPLPQLSTDAAVEMEKRWMDLQVRQLGLSSNSSHVIATRSRHDIHLKEPELLAEVLSELLDSTGGT